MVEDAPPATLAELIDAYRTAVRADDSHGMNVTSDAIRGRDDQIMWSIIDESVARREIDRLNAVGRDAREYRVMLANASAIIADALST